jgi:DNA replication and repair protein RecF
MYLTHFKGHYLRNIKDVHLTLSPELNIFQGENASGKSNLLEGIGFLLSGRSFRSAKNTHLLSQESNEMILYGQFSDSTKIGIRLNAKKDRTIRYNNSNVYSLSKITEIYPVQILTPESYHLIDSGPNERRKYLDWLLFHVENSYKNVWKQFNLSLKQRNRYLRSLNGDISNINYDEIMIWDKNLCLFANKIDVFRKNILKQTILELKKILNQMGLKDLDQINLYYHLGYAGELNDKLTTSLNRDIVNYSTSYGPHKADIKFKILGNNVKDILSRGQKKILINALILAQTVLLKKLSNKNSLFIIDDFSSELDENNQLRLIKFLKIQKNVQIIISCLNMHVLKPLIKEYKYINMFHVKHGEIHKIHHLMN